jgi:hypothetical protein
MGLTQMPFSPNGKLLAVAAMEGLVLLILRLKKNSSSWPMRA